MKFEITTTATDTSLPFMAPGFVGIINGHSYCKGDTEAEAIAESAKMLAAELAQVSAAALFDAMVAEGDFATNPFHRALAATA